MTQVTIVWGATILTGFDDQGTPCLEKDAGIVCMDGLVKEVGPIGALRQRYPAAEWVGGPDFAVTPGFVNAHHHVGLTPLQLGSVDLPLELWFASRLALRDVDLHADTLFPRSR